MSWKAIEIAPKDVFLLGYSSKTKRPFQMIWNVPDGCFVPTWSSDDTDDAVPTHFMHFPGLPPAHPEGWLPLNEGPRTGYCLGYDVCLKYPIVMRWDEKKRKYVAPDGMGDEEPTMCMVLPTLADSFVEVSTLHQAEVSWFWTKEKLHDSDHHIQVWDSVNTKVLGIVETYGITDDTTYRTQFEGRLFVGEDREKVELAAAELAHHLATLDGVMPLPAFA